MIGWISLTFIIGVFVILSIATAGWFLTAGSRYKFLIDREHLRLEQKRNAIEIDARQIELDSARSRVYKEISQ